MRRHRLFGVVGPRVVLGHLRRGVAEQQLHVELARTRGDRPGGEAVAETVRVRLLDTSTLRQSPEEHVEGMSVRHPLPVSTQEERPRLLAAEARHVIA